jgi:hypothetical protein
VRVQEDRNTFVKEEIVVGDWKPYKAGGDLRSTRDIERRDKRVFPNPDSDVRHPWLSIALFMASGPTGNVVIHLPLYAVSDSNPPRQMTKS